LDLPSGEYKIRMEKTYVPHVPNTPKCMAPVIGEIIIQWKNIFEISLEFDFEN